MSKLPPPRKKTPPPVKKAAAPVSGNNNTHSLLSPSHFTTTLSCAAALCMEKGMPNTSSPAAEEGTAMHHVAECCLNNFLKFPDQKGGKDPFAYVGTYPLSTANRAGNPGPQFTKDMAKLITPYVNYVKKFSEEHPGARIMLEERVELTELLGVDVPTKGTADFVALIPNPVKSTPQAYILVVGDLKTGRNKVYAEGLPGSKSGNSQLMGYAAGLFRKAEAAGLHISEVWLEIHGPRMGFPDGYDRFKLHPVAMRIWSEVSAKKAQKALALYDAGKAALTAQDFTPGEAACQWCRARDICGARSRAAIATLSFDEPIEVQTVTVTEKRTPPPKKKTPPPRKSSVENADSEEKSQSVELSSDEIAEAYAKLPALKAHIAATEKAMQELMFNGAGHPGYKLVGVSGGNRSVKDEAGVVKLLKGARFKDEQIYDRKLLSPAKLQELTEDKPRVWNKIQELIYTPDQKPGIAPIADPRPVFVAVKKDDLSLD